MPQDDSDPHDTTSSSATSTNEILINNTNNSNISDGNSINNNNNNSKQIVESLDLKKIESTSSLLVNGVGGGSNQTSSSMLHQVNNQKDLDEKFYPAANRIKRFPNLTYVNLYNALVNLIEIIPTVQLSPLGTNIEGENKKQPYFSNIFINTFKQVKL